MFQFALPLPLLAITQGKPALAPLFALPKTYKTYQAAYTLNPFYVFSLSFHVLSPSRRFFWVVYHFILQIQYFPPFLPFSWKSLGIRGLPAPVTPPVLLALFKKHPADAPVRVTAAVARDHARQARVSSVERATEDIQDAPGGIVITP